jgi:hypothetical protein
VADGICDRGPVYSAVAQHSPECTTVIPPRKDAVLSGVDFPPQRDHHVTNILSKGRSQWKRESRYCLQIHAENVFFRYKIILGGRLSSRRTEAQEREAAVPGYITPFYSATDKSVM